MLQALYPGRYDRSQLKERILQGMHPHLRDLMRFLYMKEYVGYEEFLAVVYGAETESSEDKVLNVKAKAMPTEKVTNNKEQNELKDLKQQIESLTIIMKSATVGNVKSRTVEGISSPRKKELLKNSPQKGFQGTPKKGKGPLKLGQKPIKCYTCDGWGHGWRHWPTLENMNWRELVGAVVSSTPGSPGSIPTPTQNQNP